MLVTIRNRWNNEVIYECEADSLRAAVEECAKLGKSLARANLAGANLAVSDLARDNLAGANLAGADLAGANLVGANLAGSNLARANLAVSDLARANLAVADLAGANLAGANLAGSNLAGANLAVSDLAGANLADANLAVANLAGAKDIPAIAIAQTRVASEGTTYGYKKVSTPSGPGIVKLLIPEYAARSNAFGRKCRCEYAEVIEAPEGAYTDAHGPRTEYRVGEIVLPDKWDENWKEECSNGIHFFITREEAEAY